MPRRLSPYAFKVLHDALSDDATKHVMSKLAKNDEENSRDVLHWFHMYMIILESIVLPKRQIAPRAFQRLLAVMERCFLRRLQELKVRLFVTNQGGSLFVPICTLMDAYELLTFRTDRCVAAVNIPPDMRRF